jgi:hypothetical protein
MKRLFQSEARLVLKTILMRENEIALRENEIALREIILAAGETNLKLGQAKLAADQALFYGGVAAELNVYSQRLGEGTPREQLDGGSFPTLDNEDRGVLLDALQRFQGQKPDGVDINPRNSNKAELRRQHCMLALGRALKEAYPERFAAVEGSFPTPAGEKKFMDWATDLVRVAGREIKERSQDFSIRPADQSLNLA